MDIPFIEGALRDSLNNLLKMMVWPENIVIPYAQMFQGKLTTGLTHSLPSKPNNNSNNKP
jgi:hypothetical protein